VKRKNAGRHGSNFRMNAGQKDLCIGDEKKELLRTSPILILHMLFAL
jgi:hypothetical protein